MISEMIKIENHYILELKCADLCLHGAQAEEA